MLIEGEAGDNGAPVDAETFYYMLQELYTVTGLMKVNGTLTEAHTFDGYGKARLWHYSDGDFNRDGAVNATDQTRFTTAMGPTPGNGKPATDPLADLDLDGDVDLTDSGTFLGIKNGGGALAELFTAATGNPFFFTGRRLYMLESLPEGDTTPVANQQLQHNRARHYSPMEGRWLQRDPAGYLDGTVLYAFCRSSPATLSDPRGKQCTKWTSDGVFQDYEKIKIVGTWTRLKMQSERKWYDSICNIPFVDEWQNDIEVDFQILRHVKTELVIIGFTPGGELEDSSASLGGHDGWFWPTVNELLFGYDDDNEQVDLTGLLCKKTEICMRKCTRTCCCEKGGHGIQRKWLHGSKSQPVYGKTTRSSVSGRLSCSLFPYGAFFEFRNTHYRNPSGPLQCSETDVPKCDE